MENDMRILEKACEDLQIPSERAGAEATILAFRSSPHPLATCRFILDHSANGRACFHAVATIQEAAIRDWPHIPEQEQSALRSYCVQYVIERRMDAYVRAKMCTAVAVLLKRGWFGMPAMEKEEFFNGMQHLAAVAPRSAAIAILEAVMTEFLPATASPLGLLSEFHDRCKASFEDAFLEKIHEIARTAAASASALVLKEGKTEEAEVCIAALRLMCLVLSWNFKGTKARPPPPGIVNFGSNGQNKAQLLPPGLDVVPISPGPRWRELLLYPRYDWLLDMCNCLRHQPLKNFLISKVAAAVRTVVVQLCSLSGDIFNHGDVPVHLHHMLAAIATWLTPVDAVISNAGAGAEESILVQGCQALAVLAAVHPAQSFAAALVDNTGENAVRFLTTLTCKLILVGAAGDEGRDMWGGEGEAFGILLEAWIALLQPMSRNFHAEPTPTSLQEAAAAVFHLYVQNQMAVAAASAHDEESETERFPVAVEARDEQLSSIAVLGRAAADSVLPALKDLLIQKTTELKQCAAARSDPTTVMEELHYLVVMCGHVLADAGEGETPLIPELVLRVSEAANGLDCRLDPVVALSSAVLDIAVLSLSPEARASMLSPRLMEALVWYLARWTGTYLISEPASLSRVTPVSTAQGGGVTVSTRNGAHSGVVTAFGEGAGGRRVLEVVVPVALLALTQWPGESDLQEVVCLELLPALVKRKKVCQLVVATESWRQLVEGFALWRAPFPSLAVDHQRMVAEVLAQAVRAVDPREQRDQYITDLVGRVAVELSSLTRQENFISHAQRPDVSLQVSSLLERLRGAARGTIPRSQKIMFTIGCSVWDPLISLLQAYKDQPAIVYLLLKFVVEWVEQQVAFLEPQEAAALFGFCLRLLQIYSANNIGTVSVAKSAALASIGESEKYKDLRVLMQLLTSLSSKDMVDFGSTAGHAENANSVAQVLYLGLHIVIPLISMELLKYPKLCNEYFTLLSHVLEVYPEGVAVLPPEIFTPIIRALDFGIRHQDASVAELSLTALSSLASFHFKARLEGQPGLSHMAVAGGSGGMEAGVAASHGETILAHFLRVLFQMLLFEDHSFDLADSLADALLPLLFCEQNLYKALVEELLAKQQNAEVYQRLAAAFNDLMSTNQLAQSLDRANRRRFRKNVHTLLTSVRGLLRMR